VRRWEGVSRRIHTWSNFALATNPRPGREPRGDNFGDQAINGVTRLCSVRARERLVPLVDALIARRGSDYQELARKARQVAAIGA